MKLILQTLDGRNTFHVDAQLTGYTMALKAGQPEIHADTVVFEVSVPSLGECFFVEPKALWDDLIGCGYHIRELTEQAAEARRKSCDVDRPF